MDKAANAMIIEDSTDIVSVTAQVTLTFWIPERIDGLLAAHEWRNRCTRSDALRAILRQYLYGLCGDPETRPALEPPSVQATRGTWGGRMPTLGKNTVEAKLSLPRRWRDDLAALAAADGITLSHFAREVVATQLLGHTFLPPRSVAGRSNAAADGRED